jgi:hypothetical protein
MAIRKCIEKWTRELYFLYLIGINIINKKEKWTKEISDQFTEKTNDR